MTDHEPISSDTAQSSISPDVILARHVFDIAEIVQEIRTSIAGALSCTTTQSVIGKKVHRLRLAEAESDIVKSEIAKRLGEHDINVQYRGKKPNIAGKSENEETPPEWVFLPETHIADRYIPASNLLPEAASILQETLPRVCAGLTLKTDASVHSVSYNAMSSLIGVEVSAALRRIPLDDIKRASFHRILVNASIELCVLWCEFFNVSVLNKNKSRMKFDEAGVHTALSQLRQLGFHLPERPKTLSFGPRQVQSKAA